MDLLAGRSYKIGIPIKSVKMDNYGSLWGELGVKLVHGNEFRLKAWSPI